jgi:subtilisin family serine protease
MVRFLGVFLALLLASAFAVQQDSGAIAARPALPVVPGKYIVVLQPGVDAASVAIGHGAIPEQAYSHALNGFAGQLSPRQVAALRADSRVLSIEADQVVSIADQTTPTGIQRIFAPGNGNIDIDGADDWRVDVDVAVIDTGIDASHPDLNVVSSTNCSGGAPWRSSCKSGGTDDNGHGTHVAGTIGALDNGTGVVGVAPGARLWAVKVLDSSGSGYMSWIVGGIDYVAANSNSIEVANMSLGCECASAAMNTAISNAVSKGVVFVVAAGNNGKDAGTFSPANHTDVITVSAVADFDGAPGSLADQTVSWSSCTENDDDSLACFSNFGSMVEIAAPGVLILSTVPGGYATYSGTSMASPHVAGAAALLASRTNPANKAGVETLRTTLMNAGNLNWTDDSNDSSKEPLLDVSNTTVFNPVMIAGSGGGGGGTTNAPPTASFTFSCTNLDCNFNTAGSSDSDGTIVSYAWNFGDGSTGSGATVSHTYASAATYTVTLTVTDDDSASDQESKSVTVSAPSAGGFTLSATGYKVKGVQKADLTWSGATSTDVVVVRGGNVIATTLNDGAYTDNINAKGGGSYTYKVCEAGTSSCSNEVTVIF